MWRDRKRKRRRIAVKLYSTSDHWTRTTWRTRRVVFQQIKANQNSKTSISMITLSNTLLSNSSTKTTMAKKVNSRTRKAVVGWKRSPIREQQAIAALIVTETCSRLAPILRLQLSAAAPRIGWLLTTSRHSMTTVSIRTTALVMPVAHDPAPRLTKIVISTTIRVRRNCQYKQWPTTWRCNFTTALERIISITWRQLITWPRSTSSAEH